MVGVTWKGARSRPSLPSRGCSQPPTRKDDRRVSAPSVSFRDKTEYQDLFKPLPKPEPIPQFTSVKVINITLLCVIGLNCVKDEKSLVILL